MALAVWLLALACGNCICLWPMAHSLATEFDAPSSSSTGARLDVRVSVSVSEHFVTLSCDVTGTRAGADDHKVQFFCPVLPGSLQCYGDCSPICTMQADGSCRVMDPVLADAGSIACQMAIGPGRESKSVRLRVDTRQPRLAGQWRCKFRGASSATVTLAQHMPAEPTVAAPAAAAPVADAPEATAERPEPAEPSGFTVPPLQARPTASSPDQYGLGVWNPGFKKYPSDLAATQGFERDPNLAKFARTDYIIGVLTIMSVSLLLNLGFCIRCVLARHYVETRKRNQRRPLDWLGSCLCVSTVQVMLDADADAAAASDNDPSAAGLQQRRRWRDGDADGPQRRQLLQQQPPHHQQLPPCLYCMQADCRILYDDVARSGSSECGSSCRGGVGGGSFRLAGGFEGHAGRSSLLGVPAVPEESVPVTDQVADKQQQDDAGSDTSASDPSSRLELSRRMLRKADTLLREANSLLLETESTTEQQPEQ